MSSRLQPVGFAALREHQVQTPEIRYRKPSTTVAAASDQKSSMRNFGQLGEKKT
jgi:hypothetical protein